MTEETRDTRERLLDAAEALFARSGFDAVSIRDIAADAGVNVAAVNYHFNSKDGLYQEVLRRVVAAKRQRQRDVFEAAAASGGDVAAVVSAFFRAHFEDVLKSEAGSHFLQLLVRELHHGTTDGACIIQEQLQPMWEDLVRAILAGVPDADPGSAPWIMGSLHGQLIHFTMRWPGVVDDGCQRGKAEAMRLLFPPLADEVDEYIDRAVEHITRFSVAGIEAVAAGKPVEGTS